MPALWMRLASFAFALMGPTAKLASEQYAIFVSGSVARLARTLVVANLQYSAFYNLRTGAQAQAAAAAAATRPAA
jgi:hypothetical protein